MKKSILLILTFVPVLIYSQNKAVDVIATEEEWKLYDMINRYRANNGLEKIPFSASLTYVAQLHCNDLIENVGYLTHGWSDCPFNASDPESYVCMWLKPQELTNYKGYGYECAHGGYSSGGYKASAEESLRGWKNSSYHNAVILNKGIWSNHQWKALGIGIQGAYACIWFGEEEDPNGEPQK